MTYKIYNKPSQHMDDVEDESIQMIITSPDACLPEDISDIVKECYRVLKPDGVFFLIVGHPFYTLDSNSAVIYPFMHALHVIQTTGFKLWHDIIIGKENVGYSPENYKDEYDKKLYSRHEHMWMFTKSDGEFKFNKNIIKDGRYTLSDLWLIRIDHEINEMSWLLEQIVPEEDHHRAPDIPTAFWKDIISLTIMLTTDDGDWVLDPMAGTGTLGVIAEGLNRNSVMYEIDPFLCELAERRLTRGI